MTYIYHRIPCCRLRWESKNSNKLSNLGLLEELSETLPNYIIRYLADAKVNDTDIVYEYPEEHGNLKLKNFNTEVISHTFENGVGIILFAEPVTEIGPAAFSSINVNTIYIPDSVINIERYAFSSFNPNDLSGRIVSIIFYSSIPPTLSSINVFTNAFSEVNIYVPAKSVDSYKTAPNWSTYADKIQAIQ